MNSTGPTPEEFDDDLGVRKPAEDVTAAEDGTATPRDKPAWVKAESRVRAPLEVRHRWYFLVYSAEGRRIGQIHATAADAERAIERAKEWVSSGQRLSAPTRFEAVSF